MFHVEHSPNTNTGSEHGICDVPHGTFTEHNDRKKPRDCNPWALRACVKQKCKPFNLHLLVGTELAPNPSPALFRRVFCFKTPMNPRVASRSAFVLNMFNDSSTGFESPRAPCIMATSCP